MTRRLARRLKLLAVLAAAGPILLQFTCTSQQVQQAVSNGLQTALNVLFDNFAEGVADGITGNES